MDEFRDIELTDFVIAVEDPFKVLLLDQDATPKEIRRQYITLSKKYHPDMIGASSDTAAELAHKRMVAINIAYQMLKGRYSPEKWNTILGYAWELCENGSERAIHLEGRGRVVVTQDMSKYWVLGPWLEFDFGPNDYDPGGYPYEFRHGISLYHLFAHLDLLDGKPMNPALFSPLRDAFSFDSRQMLTLIEMVQKGVDTQDVMRGLHEPTWESLYKSPLEAKADDESSNKRVRAARLEYQLNHILHISYAPDDSPVALSRKGGSLILEDHTISIFTEADCLLFATLVYGNMLAR